MRPSSLPHNRGVCRAGLHAAGFSLIELMIAMFLGLLLTSAIFELFATSGRMQAAQSALSRLQENGRIAISALTTDLRLAGRLPCGSQIRPQVLDDALSAHIEGKPAVAEPPQGVTAGRPYRLDPGVFISGSACTASGCTPEISIALGIPTAGIGLGAKVPRTDVLALRYLQGNGWPAEISGASARCTGNEDITSISAADLPQTGFDPSHVAMLASCTQAQIFAVDAALRPLAGKFGQPKCDGSSTLPLRLFDLDAQLQTSVYYLQVVEDATIPSRKIATLMRRTNGVVNEIVQGVERFDLLYSLRDVGGNAHWLSAAQVEQGTTRDGSALLCDVGAVRACSWRDVDAVDVDLLINTVDDLPFEGTTAAMQYRYSPDGDGMQVPNATLPVTGLPSGRMLRREFHTVVALRSLKS